MSASMNTDMFSRYFGGCPIIEIPGRLFEVKPFFLEDVLKSSKYETPDMKLFKLNYEKEKAQQQKLESCPVLSEISTWTLKEELDAVKITEDDFSEEEDFLQLNEELAVEVDEELAVKVDKVLHDAWLTGSDSCFEILLDLIRSQIIPVDWQHREATMSLLMVCAGRGRLHTLKELLDLGADLQLQSFNHWTAFDYAKNLGQKDIEDFLENYSSEKDSTNVEEEPKPTSEWEMSEEDKLLVNIYHSTVNEERVDIHLIFHMIKHICFTMGEGAILVFLPGYDDIVALRDKIFCEERFSLQNQRFSLFSLHSQMQNNDQKNVFKPVPAGVRKIILSTNIAETSITVNDVVFVIDCGKLKEKTFDALVGNTQLRTTWISQATAVQRRGRAGRCREGICYHLFSRTRFNILEKFQVPEILRVPIEELCLQSKLLAPANVQIADFLTRAPDPPAFMVTRNAVALLKTIDALDSSEALTILGVRLLELSIEPRFGKMILCSVVLSCLDPVLTIVCSLSCKDPFLLPSEPSQKKAVFHSKYEFSCRASSDHLALLGAFMMWDKARAGGYSDSFCSKHFISNATMRMIHGMKKQLMEQLRSSGFLRGVKNMKELNKNSDLWPVIKAAICAGAYPNLSRMHRNKSRLVTKKEEYIKLHRSSVLNGSPSDKESKKLSAAKMFKSLATDWVIYEEMSLATRLSFIHCCTSITPLIISLFCGMAKPLDILQDDLKESEGSHKNEKKSVTMKIDDWISFTTDNQVAHLVTSLRQKWQALFLQRLQLPHKPWSSQDNAVIDFLIAALIADEESLGKNGLVSIPWKTNLGEESSNRRQYSRSSHSRDGFANYTKFSSRSEFSSNWRQHSGSSNQRVGYGNCENFSSRSQECNWRQPSQSFRSSNDHANVPSRNMHSSSRTKGTLLPCKSEMAHSPVVVASNPRPGPSAKKHPFPTVPSTTKYFVIKLENKDIFREALNSNTCAFMPYVEPKLLHAIKENKEVTLIFTRRKSGNFEGVARFLPVVAKQKPLCEGTYGNFYHIQWLKRKDISFERTHHLKNPWDKNHYVNDSTDGQELEPRVAENLIKLWDTV